MKATLVLPLVVLAAGIACVVLGEREADLTGVLVPELVRTLPEMPELSGLAWWEAHDTLIGVSDRGFIAELSLDGAVIRRERLRKNADLEGVCIIPNSTRALVMEERRKELITVDLATFEVLETRALEPILAQQKDNRSFEGITILGDGLALAHENAPSFFARYERDGRAIRPAVLSTGESLTDLLASPDGSTILALSRVRGLARLDGSLAQRSAWHPIGARYLEGLALVPGRGLFLAVDRVPSRLLVLPALSSWAAIDEVIAGRP